MTKDEWIEWAEKRADENLDLAEKHPDMRQWHLAKMDVYRTLAMKFRAEM